METNACRLRFSGQDLEADGEIKTLSFVGLAVLAVVAFLGHTLHVALRPRPLIRLAVLGAIGLGLVVVPFVLLAWLGPLRSKMAHFVLSFFGVVAGFRWLELMLGTGPHGFDTSAKNFVIYFASPAEVLFDESGQLKASPPGLVPATLLRIAGHMLVGTLVLSLGKATSFMPCLEPSTELAAMKLLGFPQALPAVYLQTAFIYCTLATAMLMHRLLPALFGVDSVDSMRSPLLLSTSVRDFWGRRWNLVVHRLMKRTFFLPLAGGSATGRHVGGLLAFMMSGLFHEYMWLAVNWGDWQFYTPGLCLLFFLVQFLICAAEAALSRTAVGMMLGDVLPPSLRTFMTTLVVLPFGPLFLQGLQGMALQCAEQGQTLDMVPRDAPDYGPFMPPLDWAMCAAAAGLASLLQLARRRRQRLPMHSSKGSHRVVSLVGDATESSLAGA